MKVLARALTAQAFAPYGQVLQAPGAEAIRLEHAAALDNRRAQGAHPNLAIIRYKPKPLPLRAALWERHPLSTQSFIPMDVSRYLVIVCPATPEGAPDVARIDAFIAKPGQGISYNADVWHQGMAALDRPGVFANLIWQDGSQGDCEFCSTAQEVEISVSQIACAPG